MEEHPLLGRMWRNWKGFTDGQGGRSGEHPTQREMALEMTRWHRTHERKPVSSAHFRRAGPADLPHTKTRSPGESATQRVVGCPASRGRAAISLHTCDMSQRPLVPDAAAAWSQPRRPLGSEQGKVVPSWRWPPWLCQEEAGLGGSNKGVWRAHAFQRLAPWLSSASAGPTLPSQERSASPFPRSALCLNKKRNGEVANNGSKRKYATSAMDSSTKLATHTSDTQDVFT